MEYICPYLDGEYTRRLDVLIQRSPQDAVRNIQRLVFHIEKNTNIVDTFTPDQLFQLNDATLATFIDSTEEKHVDEHQQKFQSMIEDLEALCQSDSHTMYCKACKSGKDVSWSSVQTRSADEAAKIFCSCLCGKRWCM